MWKFCARRGVKCEGCWTAAHQRVLTVTPASQCDLIHAAAAAAAETLFLLDYMQSAEGLHLGDISIDQWETDPHKPRLPARLQDWICPHNHITGEEASRSLVVSTASISRSRPSWTASETSRWTKGNMSVSVLYSGSTDGDNVRLNTFYHHCIIDDDYHHCIINTGTCLWLHCCLPALSAAELFHP